MNSKLKIQNSTLPPDGPLLGAHMSIAGGVEKSLLAGKKVACDAIQIFTRSSRKWASQPYGKDEIEGFKKNRQDTGIGTIVAHDWYLWTLGSPEGALRKKSIAAFVDELDRGEPLSIWDLIPHPGAHMGAGKLEGIKTIARSLDEVHAACPGYEVKVALEITAGQGSCLGHRFGQIRDIIDATKKSERLRVCFDTAHAFASGYDIRDQDGYERTFAEFDRTVGIERIAAFHLNDYKKELSSRVDRHEHIGKGFIGVGAFRLLMNDARFHGVPMCLETPKGKDLKEDVENLALLRSLVKKNGVTPPAGKSRGKNTARPGR